MSARSLVRLLAFLVGMSAGQVCHAASTIDSLGPAIFPLPDPATQTPGENAWISQNGGDFRVTATQLGYILQAPAVPLNPFIYQLWWDTANIPPELWVYSGTGWALVGSFDRTNTVWVPPIGGGVLPTIASGATTDLGSKPEGALFVSGNSNISSFGSSAATGTLKFVLFTGTATLVNNNTSLMLPGGSNITVAAGDSIVAVALGGGNWKILSFTSSAGCSVVAGCTGQSSLTTHAVLLGEATAPIGFAVPATAGYPLLSTGASSDPAFGQLNLSGPGVTGNLPTGNLGVVDVAHGGTGVGSLTPHAVLLGEGTGILGGAGPATTDLPLIANGVSADPSFRALNLAGVGVTGVLPPAHVAPLTSLGSVHGTSFGTPGTFSFVVPAPGLKIINIGAGAGGGGGNDSFAGGGGGSGGVCYAYPTSLTVGSSLTVTIGTGGTGGGPGGGGSGASGTSGGTTSVVGGSVNVVSTGGSGGQGASAGSANGGVFGSCSGGSVNAEGLSGQDAAGTAHGVGGYSVFPSANFGGSGGGGGDPSNSGVTGVDGGVIIEWIQ